MQPCELAITERNLQLRLATTQERQRKIARPEPVRQQWKRAGRAERHAGLQRAQRSCSPALWAPGDVVPGAGELKTTGFPDAGDHQIGPEQEKCHRWLLPRLSHP